MYLSSAKIAKFCIDESVHSIIAFSNTGKAYTVKGFEIPENERAADGAIENLLSLAENEQLVSAVAVNSLTDNILLLTKKGLVKRIQALEVVQSRKLGLSAITLNAGDCLVSAAKTEAGKTAVIASFNGRAVAVDESAFKLMSKAARGMCGIKLLPEEEAFSVIVTENAFFAVSDKGMGKKMTLEDMKPSVRGGRGARIYPADTEAGNIAFISCADCLGELEFLFADGTVKYKKSEAVPFKTAVSKGNKLVSADDGNALVRIEFIPET